MAGCARSGRAVGERCLAAARAALSRSAAPCPALRALPAPPPHPALLPADPTRPLRVYRAIQTILAPRVPGRFATEYVGRRTGLLRSLLAFICYRSLERCSPGAARCLAALPLPLQRDSRCSQQRGAGALRAADPPLRSIAQRDRTSPKLGPSIGGDDPHGGTAEGAGNPSSPGTPRPRRGAVTPQSRERNAASHPKHRGSHRPSRSAAAQRPGRCVRAEARPPQRGGAPGATAALGPPARLHLHEARCLMGMRVSTVERPRGNVPTATTSPMMPRGAAPPVAVVTVLRRGRRRDGSALRVSRPFGGGSLRPSGQRGLEGLAVRGGRQRP